MRILSPFCLASFLLLQQFPGAALADRIAVAGVPSMEGDHLVMQHPGQDPIVLYPFSADGFFMKEAIETVTFGRDATGKVSQVTMHHDGVEAVNARIDAAPSVRP